MSESTIMVDHVEIKEGISQKTGKPWKRLVVKDGNGDFYSTFESGLFEPAQAAQGKRALIQWSQEGNFKNLQAIKAAEDPPTPGTGNYITGQKPPIEARRIYASTAWNCAARMAGADLGFDAAQNIANKIFHDLLIKGKAIEDEDIPF